MFDTITCMTEHWYSDLFKWLYDLTLSCLKPKWLTNIDLKRTNRTKVTSWLGYLAPRSEANDTIFQAFQVENSLKPKEHNIKLNYIEIFKWFSKLNKFSKRFTKTKQKHMGKLKSNFNTTKNPWKLLKNRQTPIKHNKTITLGDISTLKGGWEVTPDQMLTDF